MSPLAIIILLFIAAYGVFKLIDYVAPYATRKYAEITANTPKDQDKLTLDNVHTRPTAEYYDPINSDLPWNIYHGESHE